MDGIRVVIADSHPLMRLGLRVALEREAGIEVVGEAGDGIEAVLAVEGLDPDILILEVCLPEMNGPPAVRHVRVNNPDVRILVVSAKEDEESITAMLAAGVSGYFLKYDTREALIVAVRALADGQTWFAPQIISTIAQRVASRQPDPEPTGDLITTRELEVLQHLAQGLTNREIAGRLHITERTVRHHMTNIYDKLGVTSRISALVAALRRGLVKV